MSGVAGLGEESFVSLTTYRRNGEAVATPVWVATSGDALVVTTGGSSGKVKRLRVNPEVTLQPCNRRGTVTDGATTVTARAEVVEDPSRAADAARALASKYGIQYRLMMVVHKVVSRGADDRVILSIVDA